MLWPQKKAIHGLIYLVAVVAVLPLGHFQLCRSPDQRVWRWSVPELGISQVGDTVKMCKSDHHGTVTHTSLKHFLISSYYFILAEWLQLMWSVN